MKNLPAKERRRRNILDGSWAVLRTGEIIQDGLRCRFHANHGRPHFKNDAEAVAWVQKRADEGHEASKDALLLHLDAVMEQGR